MILPQQDEKGEFIYDDKTHNESFIKMWYELRRLGVKNNKFFLKLYDQTLRGVDPHSETLTQEQKLRISVEVARNPWYYIREVVRIPEDGGITQFVLNRGNLALVWCMLNNLNIMVELPRQTGKTIGTLCVYAWIYDFGTKNSTILFGNKEYADSKLNLQRLKNIRELNPSYLKFVEEQDNNALEYISSTKNKNTIKTMASATSHSQAEKLGRGATTACIYWDEFAFLKFNKFIYSSAAPAQSRAMENAMKNGTPYGKVITTTPNNLDDPAGKECYDMMQAAVPFDEIFYEWDHERVKAYIDKISTNDFVYIKFSYQELGRSERWYRTQCRNLNNDMFMVKREILLEWTYASNTSPFQEEQLSAIADGVIRTTAGKLYLLDNYVFNFVEQITDWRRPWLIGVDVAGGLMRDPSSIVICDPEDLRPMGHFKSSAIDTAELTELLCELATLMPNCVMFIERNSYGKGVIDNLLKTHFERNVYYELKTKEAEKKVKPPTAKTTRPVQDRTYGINTDQSSRQKMINEVLYGIVNDQPEIVRVQDIFNEIKNLERKKNGKIEHRSGEHDDVLFAYLMVRYGMAYGKNIPKFVKYTKNADGSLTTEGHGKALSQIAQLGKANKRASTHGQESLGDSIVREEIARRSRNGYGSALARKFGKVFGLNE
jgi:hypothetical protein